MTVDGLWPHIRQIFDKIDYHEKMLKQLKWLFTYIYEIKNILIKYTTFHSLNIVTKAFDNFY